MRRSEGMIALLAALAIAGVALGSNPPQGGSGATARNGVFGGDASLGDVTLTTQTLSGVLNYANLTISGGQTITAGTGRILHIKCTGNFANSGTITALGTGLSGGTGVSNGPGGAAPATRGVATGGGGGGAAATNAGGAGGIQFLSEAQSGTGGAVGAGGGNGNAAMTVMQDYGPGNWPIVLFGTGGGAGGGNTGVTGGGGGAGGGAIVLEVVGDVVEGTIRATGGNGTGPSGGTTGGGGGGGGGGTILILYGGTLTTGTVTANGGNGAASGGTGAAGGQGGNGSVRRFKIRP